MKDYYKNLYEHADGNFNHIGTETLLKMGMIFGGKALEWRRRFIGILPEINRRMAYKKKGYESIFVFAQKVAGLSQEQVRRVLNLERKFEGTPALKSLLVSGEVSVNKLARVASIATKENEEDLAEKVKVLPQKAVETFVRDEKNAQEEGEKTETPNGLFKPKIGPESVRAHTFDKLQLSDEVTAKLLELQEKGIDVNGFLIQALEKREAAIQQEKEEIAKELKETNSRYKPAKVQRIIQKEHGSKCSIPGCCKPATVIHHTRPFALKNSHDPRYLAPLCREHHAIAHSINVRASEMRQVVRN